MTTVANENCQTTAPKNGTPIALPQALYRVKVKDVVCTPKDHLNSEVQNK